MGKHRNFSEWVDLLEDIHSESGYSFQHRDNNHLYEKTKVTQSTKVKVKCPKHGVFKKSLAHLKKGQGCKKCVNEKLSKERGFNTEKHLLDFQKNHGDLYDYSKVGTIKNTNQKVTIICPKHGKFNQRVDSHKMGRGCPKCKSSKGEKLIRGILQDEGINFKEQHRVGGGRLDFYLEDLGCAIEYNGAQHYQSVDYFGGEEGFRKQKQRDERKAQLLKKLGVGLIKIPYTMSVCTIKFIIRTIKKGI